MRLQRGRQLQTPFLPTLAVAFPCRHRGCCSLWGNSTLDCSNVSMILLSSKLTRLCLSSAGDGEGSVSWCCVVARAAAAAAAGGSTTLTSGAAQHAPQIASQLLLLLPVLARRLVRAGVRQRLFEFAARG